MTQAQHKQLTNELDDRVEVQRPRILSLIEAARAEGDLSENGGYHAAREEQSMNETRINELKGLLKNTNLDEILEDDGVVKPGMVITAVISGHRQEFLLGTRDAGHGLNIKIYSPTAPLGKALIGSKFGETISYRTPGGEIVAVEILSVHPYQD